MAIIGHFTKTKDGFDGKIKTLAIEADITLLIKQNKQQANHPDFELLHEGNKTGAAWSRDSKRGRYISVSFDDPSFAPGFYSLSKTGAERGYCLSFERPKTSK